MITHETCATASVALFDAIAAYSASSGLSFAAAARRAGMAPGYLEGLTDADTESVDPEGFEAIARVLGIAPTQLREYRIAILLRSLLSHPDSLESAFIETLSPVERTLIAEAKFSADPLGATVWRLLHEVELTQQELAEGIGLTQSGLSRVLNGHGPASMELIEAIAQGLGVAPELFVEYRIKHIGEWLREHPCQVDALFAELNWEPTLAQYRDWQIRSLPDPAQADKRSLLTSLLEIVDAEGPVMGARVYELRLSASGLAETRELRSLINRAVAAATRAGLLLDDDESESGTQKYRILRLPTQPKVVQRTLGTRRLWQVPPRELELALIGTAAWKRGESVPRLQHAILRTYGLSTISPKDAEHLNRCITRARQGGSD